MSGPQPLPASLAAVARAADPDRYLCALFAPADRREALFALLAYNHELARARDAARTPMLALMRLQWWREVVQDAAEGRPPRRHEVAAPLQAAIAAGKLAPADLLALVAGREAEAEEAGIPTRAAFAAYLRSTAGGLAVAAGRLLGVMEAALLAALQGAGALYGLAGVLRSVPALARQGRCLLPLDALTVAGLTPEAVLAEPASTALRGVVRTLAAEGRDMLPAARRALRHLPRSALAAGLPVILAERDLKRLGAGRIEEWPRGFADRAAVTLAGLRGQV